MISCKEIKKARKQAGLSKKQAVAVVHVNVYYWKSWESGRWNMSSGYMDLFMLSTGQWVYGKGDDIPLERIHPSLNT